MGAPFPSVSVGKQYLIQAAVFHKGTCLKNNLDFFLSNSLKLAYIRLFRIFENISKFERGSLAG